MAALLANYEPSGDLVMASNSTPEPRRWRPEPEAPCSGAARDEFVHLPRAGDRFAQLVLLAQPSETRVHEAAGFFWRSSSSLCCCCCSAARIAGQSFYSKVLFIPSRSVSHQR